MEGRLIILPRDGVHQTSVFLSGTASRCILVVGSQSEGLFASPYVQALAELVKGTWSLAQVVLGSSYVGRGAPDHEADADDVDAALAVLAKEHGVREAVLYASGTGVQVALAVMASAPRASMVTRLVLQGGIVAPQSSKLFSVAATRRRVETARALTAAKRGDDAAAMAGEYDMTVTPARLHRNAILTVQEAVWQPVVGESDATCRETLRGVTVPTLFLLSTEASYTKVATAAVPEVQRAARDAIGQPADDVQVSLIAATVDEHRRLLRGNAALAVHTVVEFLQSADARREQREAAAMALAVEAERKKRVELAKALCA
ncbi:paraflagellar rod component [Novymonas esmeraldas]|uniref:Paraflagellar rod component n=1 Tax=Novymonas esmeraldas TaxID=1808958 RepID=A0AAW0F545_9TRYP